MTASTRDPMAAALPDLGDRLDTSLRAREKARSDLGRMVAEVPSAVLHPRDADDVASVLVAATRLKRSVTVRGLGRSVYGQSVPLPDGVLIDMSGLDRIHSIETDRCVVDAGANWGAVVRATLEHGLTPPALTDFLDLTVGGTLSWGGLSPMSADAGLQVDNVIALQVVTVDGVVHECSPAAEPELLDAVLGGMGLIGVITQVTLALQPAPERVRRLIVPYPDIATMSADLLMLVSEKRVDAAEGMVVAIGGQRAHMLEASVFYNGENPDDAAVLCRLNGHVDAAISNDDTYENFVGVGSARWPTFRAHPSSPNTRILGGPP